VVAVLALAQESAAIGVLAMLSDVDEDDCKTVARSLSSILLYDEQLSGPVSLVHLSFADFLVDRGRCTNVTYLVQPVTHHLYFADRCLQLLNQRLRYNICNLSDPSLANTKVKDLRHRLAQSASLQLQYAAQFWHMHLSKYVSAADPVANVPQSLDVFSSQHLLHWLEFMSLLKRLWTVKRDLPALLAMLQKHAHWIGHRATRLLDEVKHLAIEYAIPVEEQALHVYHSAQVTMPKCGLLEQAASPSDMPVMISQRADGWNTGSMIYEGHEDSVTSVVFSPDGQLIASGSDDKTVRVWNVATGSQQHKLTGHENWVTSVVFSPDGQLIASGSDDKTVRVWNVATGSQQHKLTGHEHSVTSVVFSPDGQLIASGSDDKTVRVWDVATGSQQHKLTGHENSVVSVVFSPDGQLIASGSHDKTVRVWDVATGSQQHKLTGHEHSVTSVVFSPDGQLIASGSYDSTVRVWSVATGSQQHKLSGHEESVRSVVFSPDSRHVSGTSWDGSLRTWDAVTGMVQHDMVGYEYPLTSLTPLEPGV
jgi:WD40 repeat protein